MLGNIGIEALIGTVPILGDLFDIGWKANVRNVALLRAHTAELGRERRSSRQIPRLVLVAIVLLFIGLVVLTILGMRFLYQLMTS